MSKARPQSMAARSVEARRFFFEGRHGADVDRDRDRDRDMDKVWIRDPYGAIIG